MGKIAAMQVPVVMSYRSQKRVVDHKDISKLQAKGWHIVRVANPDEIPTKK